jgi:NAD(P)-dependent dehydrogenase (short-subunit alcohol dehydrogenase family)
MRRPIHRIGLDVTDGAARSAIAAARHHFGPLDVIMNNAGDKTVAMVRNEPGTETCMVLTEGLRSGRAGRCAAPMGA